jgi:hypothetical protein
MTKRLFDHDPLTGITEWFEYDHSDDTFTIQSSQDVDALVEANKDRFNHFSSGADSWGDGIGGRTWVASIPLNIFFELKKRFGNDQEAWKRWLNDPDNRAFRTRPGTV